MATVTERHGGTPITHGVTAVHFSTTAISPNTATGYDTDNYPASPEVTYYLQAELSGQDDLRSQVAAPDGGQIYWDGVVFPAAGTWTVHVYRVSDDSSIATLAVVVA